MSRECPLLYFLWTLVCVVALFAVTVLASCGPTGWRLLYTDDHSHALGAFSVSFSDHRHGWLVTPSQLSETFDGGRTWRERLSQEQETYLDMTWVDSTAGWIVGSQSKNGTQSALLLQTTDAGKSWHHHILGVASRLNGVMFSDRKVGWAVGPTVIVNTTDAGQSWNVRYLSKSNDTLWSIAGLDAERAVAVGDAGTIVYTVDGGNTWKLISTELNTGFLRVRFFGNSGWIVGWDGTLLRTRDGGSTWERVSVAPSKAFTDIYVNGKTGWLIGLEGTIFRSTDDGGTWQQYKSPTSNDLLKLFFLDPRTGWAVGGRETVLLYSE